MKVAGWVMLALGAYLLATTSDPLGVVLLLAGLGMALLF